MVVLAAALALTWLILAVACWIGYELFRQNGRVLLRLEALEEHLGLTKANVSAGLPVGSVVHDFELPDLVGGRAVLSQWRGRRLLLIFFDPGCPFSRAMVPDLAALPADPAPDRPMPVIVTTGGAEENTLLFAPHAFNWPVLLQGGHEVAALFRVHGTPMGYLIDEQGRTASPLAVGAQALLDLAEPPHSPALTHMPPGGPVVPDRGLVNLVTNTKVQSRINRSGLTVGTPAPDFRLPRLEGGELALQDYRGRRLLLVFSDPNCGPCQALAPSLERIHQGNSNVQVLMISRGEVDANRAKVAQYRLTFPIGLQRHWEISRAYGMFATPIGYLIDEQGVVAEPVAVGGDAIERLASQTVRSASTRAKEVLLRR